MQELGDGGQLDTALVKNLEGQQRVAGLLHAPNSGDLQRRNIPDRCAVFRHPCLRESLWSTTRDDTRSTPTRAVTDQSGGVTV